MGVTNRDIEKFRACLHEWHGGGVSFNAYHDDHDRLILRLEHPKGEKAPVGLALFYCTYVSGPVRWGSNQLEACIRIQEDGVSGIELVDKPAGFTVYCASASLYGELGITIPQS